MATLKQKKTEEARNKEVKEEQYQCGMLGQNQTDTPIKTYDILLQTEDEKISLSAEKIQAYGVTTNCCIFLHSIDDMNIRTFSITVTETETQNF